MAVGGGKERFNVKLHRLSSRDVKLSFVKPCTGGPMPISIPFTNLFHRLAAYFMEFIWLTVHIRQYIYCLQNNTPFS